MLRPQAQMPRLDFRAQRFEFGGLAAVGLAAALMVWVAIETTSRSAAAQIPTTTATAGSVAELERLVAPISHWVFWVGPRQGYTYQLTQQSDGTVRIDYLPPGATAGGGQPTLAVATYPFLGASLVVGALANESCCTKIYVPGAGAGEYATTNPNDVRVGYPGVDYQIEVFDPTPGSAAQLVTSGQVAPVPTT